MTDESQSHEAAELRDLLASPSLGPDELTIVGGAIAAPALGGFLRAWSFPRDGMPYCLWETVRDWAFLRGQVPEPDALFERAVIFGPGDDISPGGDLSLRAEGDEVLWRFIGPAGAQVPPGIEPEPRSFWDQDRARRLRRCDARALLWGERKVEPDREDFLWRDDRVGWARLAYPHVAQGRLELSYSLLFDGGQVAFVWWKELHAHA
jgi:hypothetical protein